VDGCQSTKTKSVSVEKYPRAHRGIDIAMASAASNWPIPRSGNVHKLLRL
jgi:hypothetical protein